MAKKVGKRTIANLSSLSEVQIHTIWAILAGRAPVDGLFKAEKSWAYGHIEIEVLRVATSKPKMPALLSSRERDLCAMIAARVAAPRTKLTSARWWHTTTLA